MKAHTLLILAVVAVAVSANSIAAIQEKMAVADQGLIGAPFQVLVLLPGDKTQTLAAQVKTQLTIQGESHTLDITSTFVEEFLAQGGSVQELDFVLRDGQTQLLAKGRNLEFVTRSMTDFPFVFRRNRRDVLTLKHKNVELCLSQNGVQISYETSADGEFILKVGEKKVSLSASEFRAQVMPFLLEGCQLVELGKNQIRTERKTGLVFEMASAEKLLENDKIAAIASEMVQTILSKFQEVSAAHFTKRGISLITAIYKQGKVHQESSRRVLEGTVQDTASDNDAFMHTIKYVFTIVFIIVMAVVCINLYTMDIYKDSLIYAKFLVKKNN